MIDNITRFFKKHRSPETTALFFQHHGIKLPEEAPRARAEILEYAAMHTEDYYKEAPLGSTLNQEDRVDILRKIRRAQDFMKKNYYAFTEEIRSPVYKHLYHRRQKRPVF